MNLVFCRFSNVLAAFAAVMLFGCSPVASPSSSKMAAQPSDDRDDSVGKKRTAEPQELPIPSELQPRIARAEFLGAVMFSLDHGAARAQDALHAHLGIGLAEPLPGILSWVTTLDDDQVQVDFVGGSAEEPVTLYRSISQLGTASPSIEPIEPPEPLGPTATAQFWAMQTAATQRFRRCSSAYNPIVVPGSLVGEEGWLVYMMAASTKPNEAYLTGHHRFLVTGDGKSVLRHDPLSRECMAHRWEEDETPAQFHVTHLVSEVPDEAYVFANLLYTRPIAVLAVDRQEAWIVLRGRYHYFGDVKNFAGN